MKKIFLIVIAKIFLNVAFGQSLIIVRDNGVLKILDFVGGPDKSVISPNIRVLDEIFEFEFVGYRWFGDSLLVSLQRDGVIEERKYFLPEIKIKLTTRPKGDLRNFKSFYFHSTLPYAIFKYGDLVIMNKNGFHLMCYLDTALLWEKNYAGGFPKGIGASGLGYQDLTVDPKKEFVAFQVNSPGGLFRKPRSSVIEFDVLTGKEKLISRKGCKPRYSPDGCYLLFQKDITLSYVKVYDRINNQILSHYNWNSAFWLYR